MLEDITKKDPTFRYRNCKIEILQDEYPDNPRDCDYNLGIFCTAHKRYNLNNEVEDFHSDDFNDWEDVYSWLRKEKKACKIIYMYALDHGMLYIRTDTNMPDFRWDGGQIGYCFTTKERIREFYGIKKVTKAIMEKSIERMHKEIRHYACYHENDIVGFRTSDWTGEMIDSCFGYYDYQASKDDILREVQLSIDNYIFNKMKEQIQQVKKAIKSHIPIAYRKQLDRDLLIACNRG